MSRMLIAQIRCETILKRHFIRSFCAKASRKNLETSLIGFDQVKNYSKCKELFHEAMNEGSRNLTGRAVTIGLVGCLMSDGDTTWVHETSKH
jgi:hypothetical protein